MLDLKVQYAGIKSEIDAAVSNVLNSGNYILGPEVSDFEALFADFCAVKHAIAVNTGTSALHLALLAENIGPGDEVITVSMTFAATAAAILYTGAKPVLVDVDPHTWNMDVTQIESAITPRTKAIMPVHLHGLMADMDPIMEIANKHGLVVIEDACQAHGATYKGRTAGSIGKISGFSFYPGKNLGAYGEGGGIVSNDADVTKTIRMLRDWGQEVKYHQLIKGYNYRMDAVQGAILKVKMKYINAWNKQRRQVANWYHERLDHTPGLILPSRHENYGHVYHMFAIRIKQRDKIQEYLTKHGIGTGIHYPVPVHLQQAYTDLGYTHGSLPVSEQLAHEFLSLPMYPDLTEAQVEQVSACLKKALTNIN